jgi:hypothetical protein
MGLFNVLTDPGSTPRIVITLSSVYLDRNSTQSVIKIYDKNTVQKKSKSAVYFNNFKQV